jgi:trehalose 6-phosphate phosphatase
MPARIAQDMPPPVARADWALFLDIDGTLVDIAPTPDAVVVPATLPRVLAAIKERLGGALALVSGRKLDSIDCLTAPYQFPCASEHGAIIRFADGSIRSHVKEFVVPDSSRQELRAAARNWPNTILEEKQFNVVVHFRQAPSLRDPIHDAVLEIAANAGSEFEVLPARMAFEIRHRGLNKGAAVDSFMAVKPFRARVPVFVGDDVTDEDGFRAAEALGGKAVDVRTVFEGEAWRVRGWLETFDLQLSDRA